MVGKHSVGRIYISLLLIFTLPAYAHAEWVVAGTSTNEQANIAGIRFSVDKRSVLLSPGDIKDERANSSDLLKIQPRVKDGQWHFDIKMGKVSVPDFLIIDHEQAKTTQSIIKNLVFGKVVVQIIPEDGVEDWMVEYMTYLSKHCPKADYSRDYVTCDGIKIVDGYLEFVSETGKSVLWVHPEEYIYMSGREIVSPLDNKSKYIGVTYENQNSVRSEASWSGSAMYESEDKKHILAVGMRDAGGKTEFPSPIYSDRVLSLRGSKKEKKVLSQSEAERNFGKPSRLDGLRIVNDSGFIYTKRGNGIIGAGTLKRFSKLIEIRFRINGINIRIAASEIEGRGSGSIIQKEPYAVRKNRDEKNTLKMDIYDMYTPGINYLSVVTAIRELNGLKLFAPTGGFSVRSTDTAVEHAKVLIITDEFKNESFVKYHDYEFHNPAEKISWSINYIYYPEKVTDDDFMKSEWKIVNGYCKDAQDILPDYFPDIDCSMTRKEVYGEPPKPDIPPADTSSDAPFQMYISYSLAMTGYDQAQREGVRTCRVHRRTSVHFHKVHRKRKFYCPIGGRLMK